MLSNLLIVGGALVTVAALLIAATVYRIENPHPEHTGTRCCRSCGGEGRRAFGFLGATETCARCAGAGVRA
jgi:hypothetical protein